MYLRYNFCIKFRTPNFEGIVFTRRLQIKRKKINIFSKIAFMPNFHQNRRICCFVSKFEMERWLDTIEVNRLSLPKTRFLRLCPFRSIEFAKSCEASRAIKLDSPSLGNSSARNFLLLHSFLVRFPYENGAKSRNFDCWSSRRTERKQRRESIRKNED